MPVYNDFDIICSGPKANIADIKIIVNRNGSAFMNDGVPYAMF